MSPEKQEEVNKQLEAERQRNLAVRPSILHTYDCAVLTILLMQFSFILFSYVSSSGTPCAFFLIFFSRSMPLLCFMYVAPLHLAASAM